MLSAFVGSYIEYKNMHGKGNIKLVCKGYSNSCLSFCWFVVLTHDFFSIIMVGNYEGRSESDASYLFTCK